MSKSKTKQKETHLPFLKKNTKVEQVINKSQMRARGCSDVLYPHINPLSLSPSLAHPLSLSPSIFA